MDFQFDILCALNPATSLDFWTCRKKSKKSLQVKLKSTDNTKSKRIPVTINWTLDWGKKKKNTPLQISYHATWHWGQLKKEGTTHTLQSWLSDSDTQGSIHGKTAARFKSLSGKYLYWWDYCTLPPTHTHTRPLSSLSFHLWTFQSQRKAMPKNAQTITQLHSSHMLIK